MPRDKEKQREYNRLYNIKNKEILKQNRQTANSKKLSTIRQWRFRGILCFNFDLLYDIFLSTTHCEFCDIKLTTDRYNRSTTKCLDHDHSITDRFNVRGVLCHTCNNKDVLSTN